MRDTMERFMSMHCDLTARLEKSRAVDVERTKLQSPFAPWAWFSLGFMFDLVLAHERRHLWQARRILQVLDNSG
jgi:hypothetical protein